ncbi:LysR family transcriptional regulator [Rhodanobacter sp. MP1X3]|uniref:LysR family transcriptional regulator n=1 Tax=Rhodanobacter sp. MP1X3 TaxID=2723086 RepID=UPI0016148C25|nr:LysR family transcriptional regulator [Rhodanobacter sp. MP1X3]MBB6242484.1 DNA-binding transcriptional LysR family regulator [Rhodanobacter sp. MP1X3]
MAFDGKLLANLSVLAAVVESGNFARAADALGLTASGVSRAISRMEARLGIRLLHRTTRSITLTDEGERFYAEVRPLLVGIEEAASHAGGASLSVRGRLRVNVDPLFSRHVLAPRLPEFMARHSDLEIELITRDDLGDIIGEGVDVAVRFGFPPSSSLVARQLLETRIITVASPAYLKKHGHPCTPADIASHTCIQFRDSQTRRPFDWEFHKGRKVVPVTTHGPLLVSDAGTLMSVCIAGGGLAQMMAIGVVQDHLARKKLVQVLPDWADERFPLYAFYPSRHHPAAKVRSFIDFCLEILA